MFRVKYIDYLGITQEGFVIAELLSDDIENPYLLIQDTVPDHNYHEYNGIPYAEIRRSEDCEYICEV